MSEMPFFKFYHQDWIAGTVDLSATERGVYISLLAFMYDMGGKILRDDARLAMRCGARVSHFKSALNALISTGKIIEENGYLSNTRVEKEQVVYHDLKKKNSSNAALRWDKAKQNQSSNNATASVSQCQNDAIQKSEVRSQKDIDKSISKVPVKNRSADISDLVDRLASVIPEGLARSFVEHRAELKKPLTIRAAEILVKQLDECPNAIEAVEMSIANGWQGVFPNKVRGGPAKRSGQDWLAEQYWKLVAEEKSNEQYHEDGQEGVIDGDFSIVGAG
jgi:uncharacterized protein YdaU (DUF1376 family)